MDIGSAFTYMFDDEDWIKKIAIGGAAILLSIVIVPIFAVTGYMLQTLKNVRDGQPTPLPEWNDLGTLITKGLIVFVIGLIYSIPALIFYCGAMGVQFGLQEANSDVATMLAIIMSCLWCVFIVFILLATALAPAAIIRYAEFDTFSSAFQFGEIFNFVKNNLGDYIIIILLGWVAQFIAGFGWILCLIGVVFTSFWSILVIANLYGQLARKATPSAT